MKDILQNIDEEVCNQNSQCLKKKKIMPIYSSLVENAI
jgi:hypothetical protein